MQSYLSGIRQILPAADALLARYETTKLRDYVGQLNPHDSPGFQDNQDFIKAMADYTRETLGAELGEAVAEDLQEIPQVLTANHHGIDTFAQSTQSNLLFSMRKRSDGRPVKTIPVLACGSVPLNNLTYPRGFLIYAMAEAAGICKLPLFPDSYKRKLVSVVGPYTAEMLSRCRNRAGKLIEDAKLSQSLQPALNMVFDDFNDIGYEFSSYSRQATLANNRFWRRLFQPEVSRSELVYIELETIVSQLLEKDLFDESSICHQLMFDAGLRGRLIENLDQQRGCWRYESLLRRCSGSSADATASESESAQGTMFFWGVDAKGRKIPLCLMQAKTETGMELRGIDDSGQTWTCPFSPEGIAQALQQGRMLPSIFTSYLLVSIARGISCIGGYYQAEYLPVMRKGVIDSLHGHSGEAVESTDFGKLTQPDLYLSGMQTVGLEHEGQILPAGPFEIIASGGFNAEQYQQIGEVTLHESHIASLYDTIMDVAAPASDLFRAKDDVTRLIHDAIGRKIVTISVN